MVPIEKFFLGPQKNVVRKDEIIVYVQIKLPSCSQYRRLALRRSLALAITSLALSCYDTKNGEVWYASFGALAPTPIRAEHAEFVGARI